MFKVYWTYAGEAHSRDFENLSEALKECETLRQADRSFVTMVSENPNSVGKPGVDSIVDGKTPDGEKYDWNKADRIGKLKRSERAVVSTDNIVVELDDPR